jgi:hypothetical protein
MAWPTASEAGPWGMTLARVRRALPGAGSERVARRGPCRPTGGNVLQGEGLHYRASPGPVWSNMVRVDCPT